MNIFDPKAPRGDVMILLAEVNETIQTVYAYPDLLTTYERIRVETALAAISSIQVSIGIKELMRFCHKLPPRQLLERVESILEFAPSSVYGLAKTLSDALDSLGINKEGEECFQEIIDQVLKMHCFGEVYFATLVLGVRYECVDGSGRYRLRECAHSALTSLALKAGVSDTYAGYHCDNILSPSELLERSIAPTQLCERGSNVYGPLGGADALALLRAMAEQMLDAVGLSRDSRERLPLNLGIPQPRASRQPYPNE
jgi:hypothetical protein